MRTVEVLFVIIIILGSFGIASQFAVLPSSNQAFGTDLGDLSQSVLQTLDAQGILSETVFTDGSGNAWGDLQKAISASLPVNIVYNLSVYDISTSPGGLLNYQLSHSISDATFGIESDSASLLVASPNVTFTQDPQKVGESTGEEITLYILNCSDANGWWITGYTGQGLASDFYELLSPYFTETVLINSTDQLGVFLSGSLGEGEIQNAVVVNTFGESVPIPNEYCLGGSLEGDGLVGGSYAKYFHTLGGLTRQYNWTWVSIVGYPFYYVTNTNNLDIRDYENNFGLYGMRNVGPAGIRAFLQGLNEDSYVHDSSGTASGVGVVQFTANALERCNYYGIYPSPYQTASRALTQSIESTYNLDRLAPIFELKNGRVAAATFRHQNGNGALTAIGLTRIPDVRVATLGVLMYYAPSVYRSEFGATGTSRLVTLQLGQQGGA